MDTQELMMMKMIKMENDNYNHMNMNILSDPFANEVDQKSSSLGFTEFLGFQDFFSSPSSIFDNTTTYQLPPSSSSLSMDHHHRHPLNQDEDLTVDEGGEESLSSVVLNVQSPNSCSISSLAAAAANHQQQLHKPIKQCMKEKKTMGGGDETKTKKKKKEKEARFAFLTRSEIDHLDDGYRWRKYGQKAVKNSHFPRSYYRCTSASCNVKKRVERCMGDPSYVVTTYEGQHIHPVTTNSAPLIPSVNHLMNTAHTSTPPAMLKLDQLQGGLLQDMLHYH